MASTGKTPLPVEQLEEREARLELALLTALLKIEESSNEHDQKWCHLIRKHFGFPVEEGGRG